MSDIKKMTAPDGRPWRIAALGDRESVQGFMAVGFTVRETTGNDAADAAALDALAKGGCAVIFVTEDLAVRLADAISKYKDRTLPAVIAIPGKSGATGYGMESLKRSVERAVGFSSFI